MTTSQIINQTLGQEFRDAINRAYEKHGKNSANIDNDFTCLRDYAEDIGWHDDLQALVDSETTNERRHRGDRSIHAFSSGTAAKLILMQNASKGSRMNELPRSTAFLVLRKSAVEAEVIGWIIREFLPEPWHTAVNSYDYAKLMKDGEL